MPNAEYGDKSNVTLASDNIPDVMVANEKGPSFVKAAEAGAFWDLTGKLDKYPNLKPANEQTAKNTMTNGKTYGIYRVRPLLRSGIVIRKDWLAKLGLKEPQTVEDLYTIAKAFTEQDPDGNGKKDTYGLIIPKWPGNYASASPYDVVETWFGAPNGWGERDGKLVPGFDTPEFLEANRWLRKWVTEGLVNPDFATLDSANWNDPFVQGKGGMIIDVNVRATQLLDLFKEKNPKDFDKVTLVGNLKRPGRREALLPVHRLQHGDGDLQAAHPHRGTARPGAADAGQAAVEGRLDPAHQRHRGPQLQGRREVRRTDQPGRPEGQGDPERRRQGLHPARYPGQRRPRRLRRCGRTTRPAGRCGRSSTC